MNTYEKLFPSISLVMINTMYNNRSTQTYYEKDCSSLSLFFLLPLDVQEAPPPCMWLLAGWLYGGYSINFARITSFLESKRNTT